MLKSIAQFRNWAFLAGFVVIFGSAIVCSFLLAVSYLPSPGGPPTIERNNTGAEKNTAETQRDEQDRREKAANERGLTVATWVLAFATLLLFAAAAGQVFLFLWQLRLINQSLTDARIAAEAAKVSADAATLQTKISQAALESTEETTRRQLRAYIGHYGAPFENPIIITADGSRTSGPAKYFECNYGRTPAFDVSMYARIETEIPASLDEELSEADRQPVSGHIPPNQNVGRIINPRPGDGPYTCTERFFLRGYVNYTDIFGQRWRKRFAFSHDPARGAKGGEPYEAHGTHNDELKWNAKTKMWETYIPKSL